MKNTKRLLAMVFAMVFMFTVMMSGAVFADKGSDKGSGKSETTTADKVKGTDKVKTEESVTEDTTTDTDEERDNTAKKQLLEDKKTAKEVLMELRKSSDAKPEDIAKAYAAYMELKEQLKTMVREQYTAEELAQLDQTAAAIEAADATVDVLPVERVIAKGLSMKLDIPPIYKEGKVQVPVRAFVSAYGANVQWNETDRQITITTVDGKVLTISVDDGTITVDGNPIEAVRPTNVNGRIVLPVGFLAEQLGLKAEVDEEDGTVEIDEDADDEVVDPLPDPTIAQ